MRPRHDTVVCVRLLVKDYDPREDHAQFGNRGFGPQPIDGLVLTHSLNKMAEQGQGADEYVNGIRRYLYH